METTTIRGAGAPRLPRGELEARADARSTLRHGLAATGGLAAVEVLVPDQLVHPTALLASLATVCTMAVSSYVNRAYVAPYRRIRRLLVTGQREFTTGAEPVSIGRPVTRRSSGARP